jgi:hypothetical protein
MTSNIKDNLKRGDLIKCCACIQARVNKAPCFGIFLDCHNGCYTFFTKYMCKQNGISAGICRTSLATSNLKYIEVLKN